MTDAERLRAAFAASGLTQPAYARRLGLAGKSSLAPYFSDPPTRNPIGPTVRLAWLLQKHPEHVAELAEEFGE